jgi:hypothetical protein
MEKVPVELLELILAYCAPSSWLALQKTSRTLRLRVTAFLSLPVVPQPHRVLHPEVGWRPWPIFPEGDDNHYVTDSRGRWIGGEARGAWNKTQRRRAVGFTYDEVLRAVVRSSTGLGPFSFHPTTYQNMVRRDFRALLELQLLPLRVESVRARGLVVEAVHYSSSRQGGFVFPDGPEHRRQRFWNSRVLDGAVCVASDAKNPTGDSPRAGPEGAKSEDEYRAWVKEFSRVLSQKDAEKLVSEQTSLERFDALAESLVLSQRHVKIDERVRRLRRLHFPASVPPPPENVDSTDASNSFSPMDPLWCRRVVHDSVGSLEFQLKRVRKSQFWWDGQGERRHKVRVANLGKRTAFFGFDAVEFILQRRLSWSSGLVHLEVQSFRGLAFASCGRDSRLPGLEEVLPQLQGRRDLSPHFAALVSDGIRGADAAVRLARAFPSLRVLTIHSLSSTQEVAWALAFALALPDLRQTTLNAGSHGLWHTSEASLSLMSLLGRPPTLRDDPRTIELLRAWRDGDGENIRNVILRGVPLHGDDIRLLLFALPRLTTFRLEHVPEWAWEAALNSDDLQAAKANASAVAGAGESRARPSAPSLDVTKIPLHRLSLSGGLLPGIELVRARRNQWLHVDGAHVSLS